MSESSVLFAGLIGCMARLIWLTAGAKRELFDGRAREALYEMGRGNPRATDVLARGALECAHRAGAETVAASHVVDARATLPL